ncbi:hypothetical protein PM10SUCC1_31630 [Propionigenium maris DSM 9537]|uniref:Uncharacterized protein n=1 Tax=Propionigenium maris DSM 9537 TaxID=1123000 RepID=A0A9W6LP57_9FUSO|nr:hypothetical protein [Propionigenium maris]GLI57649.1 hypothetical protein PM10SUCC1_31630 [Propionigenium maris DSM 9537]
MKKILLVLMMVILTSLSLARDRDNADFYDLYNEAYRAVETPGMHKDIGMEADEVEIVKNIINKGWYELKIMEADKLREVFAIDKLLIDGPGNREKIDGHFKRIREINAEMDRVYNDTGRELKKHIDLDKAK